MWVLKITACIYITSTGSSSFFMKTYIENKQILWDKTPHLTIVLPVSVYFVAVKNGLGLWDQFALAFTLVHELAHACTLLWRPESHTIMDLLSSLQISLAKQAGALKMTFSVGGVSKILFKTRSFVLRSHIL